MENNNEIESNESLKKDVNEFFLRKDIIIKLLDNLEYSCITGKDIFEKINEFDKSFCSEDFRLLWNLFARDEKELVDMFNNAKILEEEQKILFDLKSKYKLTAKVLPFHKYLKDIGAVNRWTDYEHRSYYDSSDKRLMIEFELESMNKIILHVVDDAGSLYRLAGVIEYVVREELQELIENKIPLDKELIDELKVELKENEANKEKLVDMLNKSEKMKK